MSKDTIVFNQEDLPEDERQVLCVKEMVRQTLFAIDEAQGERRAIVNKIQNLQMDVRDFKAGRLDRLFKRHSKFDPDEALSVVEIEKIEGIDYDRKKWSPYYLMRFNIKILKVVVRLPGFLFHEHTVGTYDLGNGKIKNL